ncbi:hypothetical protein DRE_02587 [Drechslerella stenobrocha 248]|uniref:Uncharacterized protein n=1 Tax=Drechslerella stenobrocha 248 TaxID=1043628 RepID=W7I6W8_9PEZI|nr:hypothetical protein DRE_02587 [Drechslerella stenobrocha 248]
MLTRLLRLSAATIRSAINFFLSPLFFVVNVVFGFFSRRSKTAANAVLKAQLIRDIIFQAPPPSYQSTVKPSQSVARIRVLESSLQKRESDLASRSLALERDRHLLEIKRDTFAKREAEFTRREKSSSERASLHGQELVEFTSKYVRFEQDVAKLQEEQRQVLQLREAVKTERSLVDRLKSEHALNLQQFQKDQAKHQDNVTASQQRLEHRESEISKLHDRFIRSQIESVERYRSEHDALVESLQSRLKDSSDQNQKTEQIKMELEQRLAFLTNELADRTDREFNLGAELGQLRQKLSDERGAFNREFGELSRSLSELKLRCSQYEKDLEADDLKKDGFRTQAAELMDREADIAKRDEALQRQAKFLNDLDASLNAREAQLIDGKSELDKRETILDSKAETLLSLQNTIEERISHLAEAETDLSVESVQEADPSLQSEKGFLEERTK